jgi:hypothetical protein
MHSRCASGLSPATVSARSRPHKRGHYGVEGPKQARRHVCHAVAGHAHYAMHANDFTSPANVICGSVGVSR